MDLRDRRDLYNGFGDGLSRAFEFVATPAVFGVLGFWIDRRLELLPLFTLLLTFLALGVTTYLTWLRYDAEMKRHDDRRRENLRRPTPLLGIDGNEQSAHG